MATFRNHGFWMDTMYSDSLTLRAARIAKAATEQAGLGDRVDNFGGDVPQVTSRFERWIGA